MADVSWFLVWRGDPQVELVRSEQGQPTVYEIEVDMRDPGASLAQALCERGYEGEPVVLGLPSHQCLTASIASPNGLRDRPALLFALEENLPSSAENLVADFIFAKDQQTALGIAIEIADVQRLVESLSTQGIEVRSLAPTALLAVQDILRKQASPSCAILWKHEHLGQIFVFADGQLTHWSVGPFSAQTLFRESQMLSRAGHDPTCTTAYGMAELPLAGNWFDHAIEHAEGELLQAAARQADRVVRGQEARWIELRRDRLAAPASVGSLGGLASQVALLAAICLLVIIVSLQWRAARYRGLAERYEQRQRELFQQTFPSQPVPLGIRSRMESELGKLTALAEQSRQGPPLTSELDTLLRLLRSLPDDVHYRWDHIRVEAPGQLLLEGELVSQQDAQVVVDALKAAGFEVEAPQTSELPSELVSVRIRGKRAPVDG